MSGGRTAADRTILFADVCDSTSITESMGDEESRRWLAELLARLRLITEANGGTLIKTIGDEIMTSFESPDDCVAAAMDMQLAVSEAPIAGGSPVSIKIGLHSGPVLLEGGDVFGDVVNVAARVVGLAAARQILTTGVAIERLGRAEVAHRSLGSHRVRGRDQSLHLHEILWRGETAQLTVMAPESVRSEVQELHIALGDQEARLTSTGGDAITLGRGGDRSIIVPSASASRSHAVIRSRGGRFYLHDQSANGTYVRPDGAKDFFVHRDQALLQGVGLIRLGEPVTEPGAVDIEYRVRQGD